ncbi:MAG: PilZ domain-containing protein [Gammaproteobacteria bacterium]
MIELEKNKIASHLQKVQHSDKKLKNDRKTIRYIRKDIQATLCYTTTFGLKKSLSVDLNDISSRGILITTDQKLSIGKKVTVIFSFKTGKLFRISAVVVRKCKSPQLRLGIAFEKQENKLGDYLLQTQTDLIFK